MTASFPCSLKVVVESLPLNAPFRISGYTFHEVSVVVVTLRAGDAIGRGEAAGVFYLGDGPQQMIADLDRHRQKIEAGVTRDELRMLMPRGGGRNAVDCALWELEAKRAGTSVARMAGLQEPRPLLTALTLGADEPSRMLERAATLDRPRALKLKLTGTDISLDAERVRRVRAAYPAVWIGVDGNQGFTRETFAQLLPTLTEARVQLVEQPLPRGCEGQMADLECPIPTAADESLLGLEDLDSLVGRFDFANIKLDKCGGLTEALLMAERARALGLRLMVGNMTGSSWAMAPAFLLGQVCDLADLDGVTFLTADRAPGVSYTDGFIQCPEGVWGGSAASDEGNGRHVQ